MLLKKLPAGAMEVGKLFFVWVLYICFIDGVTTEGEGESVAKDSLTSGWFVAALWDE